LSSQHYQRRSAPAAHLAPLAACFNGAFRIVFEVTSTFLTAFASGFSSTLFVSCKVSRSTAILSHSVFLFEFKIRIVTVNASSGRFNNINVDRILNRSSTRNKKSVAVFFIGGTTLFRDDNAIQLLLPCIQKKSSGAKKLITKIAAPY
jgi:hypothetical protein